MQSISVSFPDTFNIKLVWLESLLQVFGGGDMVATSLILTTCTDVTPQSKLYV